MPPGSPSQFASNKGRLPWPVDGTVTDTFGERNHPVYKNVKLPFNNGVTVTTAAAAPVKAVWTPSRPSTAAS